MTSSVTASVRTSGVLQIATPRLVASATREDFADDLDNPVDMAHHYLKLLEKREFKRSHFKIISS